MAQTKHFRARAAASRVLLAVGLLMLILLAVQGGPAEATFPGDNGKIAWLQSPSGHPETTEIYTNGGFLGGSIRITHNNAREFEPSYSPDGRRIVYSAYDGNDFEIFTVKAEPPDVGIVQRVTNTDDHEYDPCYASYDGTKIAYSAWDGNDLEIFTISASGGTRFNVTNNDTYDGYPTFSKFGPKIGFLGRDERGSDPEIYSIRPTGEDRQQWTNNVIWEAAPDYQPTGTRMLYVASDGHDDEIYRVHRPRLGKFYEPEQITNNLTNDSDPVWSPNAQEVAYSHRTHDFDPGPPNWEIFAQCFGGGIFCGAQVTVSDYTDDMDPAWQAIPRSP
jgi:Tol biopolymer transport system component